jgi:hypothetical protein
MASSYYLMNESKPIAESRLWQAVIVSTIEEWISGPLRLKRQAEEYLFRDDSDFPAVCQSAGMDVGRLRAKLIRLRTQSAAAKAPVQVPGQAPVQSPVQSNAQSLAQPAVPSSSQLLR